MEASIKSKVEERLEFRYLVWKRRRVYYFPRAGSQWRRGGGGWDAIAIREAK